MALCVYAPKNRWPKRILIIVAMHNAIFSAYFHNEIGLFVSIFIVAMDSAKTIVMAVRAWSSIRLKSANNIDILGNI